MGQRKNDRRNKYEITEIKPSFFLNDRISNGFSHHVAVMMNKCWIVVRFSRLFPNWLQQLDLFVCHLNNLFHTFSTFGHNSQVNRLLLDSFVLRDKQQTVVDIWQSNNHKFFHRVMGFHFQIQHHNLGVNYHHVDSTRCYFAWINNESLEEMKE